MQTAKLNRTRKKELDAVKAQQQEILTKLMLQHEKELSLSKLEQEDALAKWVEACFQAKSLPLILADVEFAERVP